MRIFTQKVKTCTKKIRNRGCEEFYHWRAEIGVMPLSAGMPSTSKARRPLSAQYDITAGRSNQRLGRRGVPFEVVPTPVVVCDVGGDDERESFPRGSPLFVHTANVP